MRLAFTETDNLLPISPERAERRARIAAMMERTRKASEAALPPEEQRQAFEVPRYLLTDQRADALAAGGTLQIGASDPHRGWRIAGVLAAGLPAAVLLGYLGARCLAYLADAVGAAIA